MTANNTITTIPPITIPPIRAGCFSLLCVGLIDESTIMDRVNRLKYKEQIVGVLYGRFEVRIKVVI